MPRLLADLTPLRISAPYRRLRIGSSLAAIGSSLTVVAVGLHVFALTGSSFYVGVLSLFALVPLVVFGLLGGSIADAFDRRTVALLSAALMWGSSMVLALLAWLGAETVWSLYILVALNSAGLAVNQPTRTAIIPQLVGKKLLPAANALSMITFTLAAMIGPVLGGFLVATVGFAWTYTIDVVTFLAALWGLLSLPKLPPEGTTSRPGLRSVAEGFRFLSTRPVVRGTFVIDLIAMITAAPRALVPAIAALALGGGEVTAGLLLAAVALGSFLAGVFSGQLGVVRRQGAAVLWCVAAWGFFVAVLGATVIAGRAGQDGDAAPGSVLPVSGWLIPALIALVLAGAADAISSVYRSTILQSAAPDNMRGRLAGVFIVVVAGGPRVGDFIAGSGAAWLGEGRTLVIGGLLCIVLTCVFALWQPVFRRFDARAPEVEGEVEDA